MGVVPRAQGGVELGGVDADEQASHRRQARHPVVVVAAAHAEAFQRPGAEVVDPFADGLVAAHAAQRRRGGKRQHRGQRMAPSLAPAGVVDAVEELGQGSHLYGGECHLGHSMSQAGLEMGGPKPGSRAPAQGMNEHELGPGVLGVAVPVTGEAAGSPDLDPVGGAVDGAPKEPRVDEGLRQKQLVSEAGRPVAHQAARAQRKHPRAEVARATGENQEPGVVGDQVQPGELHAVVPADPPVARPALQRRRREHRQRQPPPSMMSDITHRLAHPRHRAEVVVRPHQIPEADLIVRRHDVDAHLGKNHHGFPAPTIASRHSYQDAERKSSIPGNLLSGRNKAQCTNPPCVG